MVRKQKMKINIKSVFCIALLFLLVLPVSALSINPESPDADNIPPEITLLEDATVTITVGDTYTDAGATATDDVDDDITANIVTVNPVDTTTAGTYTVTYNVSDAAGNPAPQVVRTVNVQAAQDEFPPGDIDHSGAVDLSDVILALQVCANITPSSPSTINADVDVNADDKIGLEEAIYGLQIVSEIR